MVTKAKLTVSPSIFSMTYIRSLLTHELGDLSRISLRWMINECKTLDTGILFEGWKEKAYTDGMEHAEALFEQTILPSDIMLMAVLKAQELSDLATGSVPESTHSRSPFGKKPTPVLENNELFKTFILKAQNDGPTDSPWMKEPNFQAAIRANATGSSVM